MSNQVSESTELVPTTASLAPLRGSAIVTPAVQASQALEAQTAYHELCTQLLDASDYQTIGQKDFRKKSGWRKLAVAFNVSNKIVSREYERDERGRIIRAEVVDQAIAPNGRTCDGLGACDLFEKCCSSKTCRVKGQWHDHCDKIEGGCDGTRHFSNPQHDIPATAATRARNRACADLFGMGEVSAEEITNPDRDQHYSGRNARAGEEDDQREWYEKNGWVDEADHTQAKAALMESLRALSKESQQSFGEKRRAAKIDLSMALTKAEHDTMQSWVAELQAAPTSPSDSTGATESDAKAKSAESAPPPGDPSPAPAQQKSVDVVLEPEGDWSQEQIAEWVKQLDADGVAAALAKAELDTSGRMPDKRIRLREFWQDALSDDEPASTDGEHLNV